MTAAGSSGLTTGPASSDTGGTGLGVAIARQLAQTLGASLSPAQREGGGWKQELAIETGG